MVKKYGVNGFANKIIAAKGKGHIAQTTRGTDARQVCMHPFDSLNKIDCVVVVLFNAGSNGEYVRIENDVSWVDICLLGEDIVAALTDIDLTLIGIGLALLVEGHNDHGRAKGTAFVGETDEGFFTFLEAE